MFLFDNDEYDDNFTHEKRRQVKYKYFVLK